MRSIVKISAVAMVLAACGSAGALQNGSAGGEQFGSFDSSSIQTQVPLPAAPDRADGPAGSGDMASLNSFISRNFGGIKADVSETYRKSVPAAVQVLDRLALDEILDANLETRIIFKTSSGNTVHVSGALAANCDGGKQSCSENDRYFLLFHTDKGQTIFVRGTEIANAMFMSGSKEISFDGDSEKYVVKLMVKITSPGSSRLQVQTQGRMALDVSLDQLTAALAEKGKALKAGSRHNVFYNTEVLQDKNGRGYFGKGKVVVFSPRTSAPNQYVSAAVITAMGVLLDTVEPDLGFRIVNGALEIYKM